MLVCSAVITTGSDFGAFGVRTSRAMLVAITPSRNMYLKSDRTAASLRRMLTAVSFCAYKCPSHSRIASRSISSTATFSLDREVIQELVEIRRVIAQRVRGSVGAF